jgi:hypothetical protein
MVEIDDGRRLLLLAAAGSVTPLIVGTAGAKTQAPDHADFAISQQTIASGKLPAATILKSGYSDLKNLLRQANAWDPTFDLSFLESSTPLLQQIAEEEKKQLHHNRRLVEPLLGEISALIDRCIAYRREGADLELQGISAGINEYLSYTLDQGDLLQSTIDPSYAMATTLADKYGQAARQLLAPGDEAARLQLEALGAANGEFAKLQAQRVSWQSSRLKQTQDIGRQLIGRYHMPGNAHNFGQRFDRVRRLFESDVTSAYRRAIAAREGLKQIFDFSDDANFPDPKDPEMLDNFIQWTRNAMRAVALIGETEIEFTQRYTLTYKKDESSFPTTARRICQADR